MKKKERKRNTESPEKTGYTFPQHKSRTPFFSCRVNEAKDTIGSICEFSKPSFPPRNEGGKGRNERKKERRAKKKLDS